MMKLIFDAYQNNFSKSLSDPNHFQSTCEKGLLFDGCRAMKFGK